MRRLPLLTIAVVAALASSAAVASAADVTVNFSRDGGSRTVSIESLSGRFDVNQEYALVSESGQTTTKQIQGISLRALLEAVGADPTYAGVTIVRPGGGTLRMSRTQIEAGGLTPVVYSSGGLATFVRPSYGKGDQNAADVISASPLVISQVDGNDYGLKATVSKSSAKAGESLKFAATANGAAGQTLEYTWNFQDGTSATGAEVTHRFKKRGYYRVLVSVRGKGEKASSSTVVVVQVGKAKKSNKTREGGGNNDAAGAPVSGQADGSSGDGQAAGSTAVKPKSRKKSRDSQSESAQLQSVTGQLLSGEQAAQADDLAARSGQKLKSQSDSAGVPTEAAGAAAVLGLLGFGIALEMGAAGRLRRRLGV